MPNWCFNHLRIEGSSKYLIPLREFIRDNDVPLSFRKIVPPPDDRMIDTNDGYNGNAVDGWKPPMSGYDWCIKNWGTKWGAHEVKMTECHDVYGWLVVNGREKKPDVPIPKDKSRIHGKGSLEFVFDTAWSPPVPVITALSKKFPHLDMFLQCEEAGSEMIGAFTFRKGVAKGGTRQANEYELPMLRGG
jgi:hypothetical protein